MKVLGNNGYPKQFVMREAVKAQIQNTDQPKQSYATIVIHKKNIIPLGPATTLKKFLVHGRTKLPKMKRQELYMPFHVSQVLMFILDKLKHTPT